MSGMNYEGLTQVGYAFPPFVLDKLSKTVKRRGADSPLPLKPAEFQLLLFFVENPKTRFSVEALSTQVLGAYTYSIREHVSNLREKLAPEGNRLFPKAVKGEYMLDASPRKITNEANLEAIQLFEAGEDELNRHHPGNLEHAVKLYRRCIDKCTTPWGLPYLRIAEACINLGHIGFCRVDPAQAFAAAREAIRDAVEIDPTLPDIHAHSALLSMFEWRWEDAEQLLRKALDPLSPPSPTAHSYYAHFLVSHRRFVEAIEEAKIARGLDPSSTVISMTVPWIYFFAGRFDEAKSEGEKIVEIHPEHAPSHVILALAKEARGETEAAIQLFDQALGLDWSPLIVASLGHAYGKLGKPKEVERCRRELQDYRSHGVAYLSPYFYALLDAGSGDRRGTLQYLERAFNERWCDFLIHLWVEPRWTFLHSEPGYKRLLVKAGFLDLGEAT